MTIIWPILAVLGFFLLGLLVGAAGMFILSQSTW